MVPPLRRFQEKSIYLFCICLVDDDIILYSHRSDNVQAPHIPNIKIRAVAPAPVALVGCFRLCGHSPSSVTMWQSVTSGTWHWPVVIITCPTYLQVCSQTHLFFPTFTFAQKSSNQWKIMKIFHSIWHFAKNQNLFANFLVILTQFFSFSTSKFYNHSFEKNSD